MNAAFANPLPEKTLPQMLREQARIRPDRIAIRQKDFGIWQPLTWAGYLRRATHVALGFVALGVPRGGHVAVISENRLEWVLSQMGASLIGAVTVGVYPTSPPNEVAYVVGHADVDVIVCEDQEQADKILACIGQLPRLKRIVVMETKGLASYAPEERARILSFAELEQAGAAVQAEEGPERVDAALGAQQLDDLALMVYTSGSTGAPKGAMLSWRAIRGVVPGIVDRLELSTETTHLSYLPLCHVAEQMLTCFVPLYLGSLVNFGESIRTVQEDLREVAPNMFIGVPRIWEKLHASISIKMQEAGAPARWLFRRAYAACAPMAEKPRTEWSLGERLRFAVSYWLVFRALQNFIGLRACRVAMTGAAPIPQDIVRFFRVLGVPLVEVYGLTETAGMVTGHRGDGVRIGTVGPPTLGVEVRQGEQGELLVRGDMVFSGYYKNPEATAAALQDGWLHTGDVVELAPDGHVRIVDRLKDIIITAGGKNLTPSEIENTMKASPFIKECIVIGEGRRFVSALVQIDYETVGKWAEAQRLAFTHFRSLVDNPRVRALVDEEIRRGNERLAQVAQIRKFHLLTKELDHDDGEVTATMKVRRSSIYKTYAPEIEALYA
ncbi:AMP-binding protein [Ramlibacter sp.]|uniref:AMP-dependent synthetase/ligase n=1 Tax=Ramlibacter sp. TaxID=1917967 RepID=UPI0017E42947|nr:AMP-binding protein [Ramlibacter sp.]MBA2675130.1 AMP-binding protein [Ramlibacter sp.]